MGRTTTTKDKTKVQRAIEGKTEDKTTFFYYAFRNVIIIGIPLIFISALILSLSHSSATTSGTDNLAITISSSCTLGSVVNTPHSKEVYNGNYETNIGKTTITTLCNDGNGYSIYANGYSNNEEGNNQLVNSSYPQYSIDTGLSTSGLTSAWAMKLNNIENDPSPTPPVITSAYDNTYGLVPNDWIKVASRTAGTTDMDEGSSFTTTYAVYASSNQHTGSYVGQVKYLLTHPSTRPVYPFMQDVATWKDTELSSAGDSLQAIDSRDGKKYWVTRLADGNVWMTQNLAIDLSYVDGSDNTVMRTFTSNDTDLNVIYDENTGTYPEYGGNNYTIDSNNVISWAPKDTATTSTISGTGNGSAPNWVNSTIYPYSAKKIDGPSSGHESLGNYYNWTAAIASNDSTSLASDTKTHILDNPKNSICPKGWRLPTISDQADTVPDSTNEFGRLNQLYNDGLTSGTNSGAKLMESPLWFVRPGVVDNTSLSNNYESNGYYWSSTVRKDDYAYYLDFSNGSVNPASYYYRDRGRSVRCVAR